MVTYLVASKRTVPALLMALIIVDVVVGATLISASLGNTKKVPNGVRFGFYKTTTNKKG